MGIHLKGFSDTPQGRVEVEYTPEDRHRIIADSEAHDNQPSRGTMKILATVDDVQGQVVHFRSKGKYASLFDNQNFLAFVSKTIGAVGNTFSVEYIAPDLDETLLVTVVGNKISVRLASISDVTAASLETSLGVTNGELVYTANDDGTVGNNITIQYATDDLDALIPGESGSPTNLENMESGTGWTISQGGINLLPLGAGWPTDEVHDGSHSLHFGGGDGHHFLKKTRSAVDLSTPEGLAFWLIYTYHNTAGSPPPPEPINSTIIFRAGTSDSVYWEIIVPAGTLLSDAWRRVVMPKEAFVAVGGISSWAAITQFVFGIDTTGSAAAVVDTLDSVPTVTGTILEDTTASADGNAITVQLAGTYGGNITATADDVIAAIEADVDSDALVTVEHAPNNDGSGVVTTYGPQSLANGSDGGVISTASEVKDALEANAEVMALVKVIQENNGVMEAMSETFFSGGNDTSIHEGTLNLS